MILSFYGSRVMLRALTQVIYNGKHGRVVKFDSDARWQVALDNEVTLRARTTNLQRIGYIAKVDEKPVSAPLVVAEEAGDVIDCLACCGRYTNVYPLSLDTIQHMANDFARATVEYLQRAKTL